MTTNLPVIDPTCAHNMALYWEGGMTYRIVKHPRRPWEIEQVSFDEVAMDAARGRCDDN